MTLSESSTSSSPLELATMKEMTPESSGFTESMSNVDVKQLRELSACGTRHAAARQWAEWRVR